MAQTFWTGSNLSFTNGSKIVTVNTGPSVDSIFPNSKLKSGNYNEPVEVKAAYGSTIELYENWPGSTANTSATVTPSSAAAAAAGVAAQQVVTEIQNLVGSASATATANSFVKRDSNGRIKAANPSANDDVVTKGFIGSAATKDVGTNAGNVMEVGAFGLGNLAESVIDNNPELPTGFYSGNGSSSVNFPDPSAQFGSFVNMVRQSNNAINNRLYLYEIDSVPHAHIGATRDNGSTWSFSELYHSGNTNFNEFGSKNATDYFSVGYAYSSTALRILVPLNNKVEPTSITISSGCELQVTSLSFSGSQVVSASSNLTLRTNDSTNRVASLNLQGLIGLQPEIIYYVRFNAGNHKITVNL